MKEVLYLFVFSVIVIPLGMIVLPREEIGTLNRQEVGSCSAFVQLEPYSPKTFFKTFICQESLNGLFCEHLIYEGGKCVKNYYYFQAPEEQPDDQLYER